MFKLAGARYQTKHSARHKPSDNTDQYEFAKIKRHVQYFSVEYSKKKCVAKIRKLMVNYFTNAN